MKKLYFLISACSFIYISAFSQSPHAARLYGMTQYGGTDHKGTIFHYTPETHAIQVDYEMKIKVKGSTPKGDIVTGNNGKYYGTTTAVGQPISALFTNGIRQQVFIASYTILPVLMAVMPGVQWFYTMENSMA